MPAFRTGTKTSHSDNYLSARRSNSLPPNTFSSAHPGPVLLWNVNRRIPTRFPVKYNPDVMIPDRYSYGDPAPASCQYLTDQVFYKFTSKKLLAGYDLEEHEYVLATIPAIGLDALFAAMQSNSSDVPPAYCHHLENADRPMEWSRLHLYQRHQMDYNPGVVGYLMPSTHTCIAQPIYHSNTRKQALRDLEFEILTEDHLEEASVARQLQDESQSKHGSASNDDCSLFDGIVLADDEATFYTEQLCYSHADLISSCEDEKQLWIRAPNGCPIYDVALAGALSPPLTSLVKPTPKFSKEDAEKRKKTDSNLVSSILDSAEKGVYVQEPSTHPAFDLTESGLPRCLQVFSESNASINAWRNMGHLRGSVIGTLIVRFNGKEGIALEEFAELRKRSHKCASCLCFFSFEAYHSHVQYDLVCKNTPELELVPNLGPIFLALPPIPVERSPAGTSPVCHEAINNPVGLAWLTWNSPVGITHDAWAHIMTAWRKCPAGCGRVRSFQGHLEHIADDPVCSQVGDWGLEQ